MPRTSKRTRTYKLAPIAPFALYVTRQQAAAIYGVNVQQVDKWVTGNTTIHCLRPPGRGTYPSRRQVLICRADLEAFVQQFAVRP